MSLELPGDSDDVQRPGHGASRAQDRWRVSDAERQVVVDALRRHTGDGRLSIAEFEERSATVLAARTRGDLRGVLDDLPPIPGAEGPATAWAGAEPSAATGPRDDGNEWIQPVGRPRGPSLHFNLARWRSFAYVSLLMIAIWVMSGAGYFWPGWVIVPLGLSTAFGRGHRGVRSAPPSAP